MSTPSAPRHVDVAAYVLGILDEPDDAAFSQHFADCKRCRAEFRELSDLPQLLGQLKPAQQGGDRKRSRPPAMPGKQVLSRALDQVNTARRTQRTTMWLGAAAALILLITVPLIVWRLNVSDSPPAGQAAGSIVETDPTTTTSQGPPAVAGARTVTATNPATGVIASITMEPESWGTSVNLELRGVMGPLQGTLVAVSKTGVSKVVSTFTVPASGFGVPNSPEPLRQPGGVGMDMEQIDRFDIRRDNGPDLLVVES